MTIPAIDPAALVRKACGFLEESPGVKSSTRLLALICVGCATALTIGLLWYVWYCTTLTPARVPDSGTLNAIVLGIGAFVAQGAVAITKRGNGD
jgi:hypothetical protein